MGKDLRFLRNWHIKKYSQRNKQNWLFLAVNINILSYVVSYNILFYARIIAYMFFKINKKFSISIFTKEY